jgi:hypothetical protein
MRGGTLIVRSERLRRENKSGGSSKTEMRTDCSCFVPESVDMEFKTECPEWGKHVAFVRSLLESVNGYEIIDDLEGFFEIAFPPIRSVDFRS